ncbi:relaxase/mobilization nuclease domain-containing protein [Enterococcus sp. DIV1420a]|uniref:relaxase/mobilization nuclease domain-containing protein n=1 Tax=Enterococcus sp. DIV1420a TaxID=2774672 RepID=UPI003F21B312
MPTTKSFTIKEERNLRNAIKYILDPEKTKSQTLTSGYKINLVNNAFYEMSLTRDLAEKIFVQPNKISNNKVIARHIIQSFDPNDNLTPEEVHEIGRQTAFAFLGNDYEFVIATHTDKDHLHNHIIFNTTSTVDLKKFRWQKRTTADLRNISDKVADYHGATTLKSVKRNSYRKYQEYRKKYAYRMELKERLNFLLKHSTSWEDFIKKARLLNITVDPDHQSKDYGKVINYRLLDMPQQRPARDYTLNKKHRIYNEENILERTSKNDSEAVYHIGEIAGKYAEHKAEKESLPDLTFLIEPWQIQKDTMTGIYVEFSYGRYETGVIKIPDFMLDQCEDGRYEVHFNYKDTFYFLNEGDRQKNKFVKGSSLSKYLLGESGLIVKRKNSAIQNVREMVTALNILSTRQVKNDRVLKVLGQDFHDNYEEVQEARGILNEKLFKANEKLKFSPNDSELQTKAAALRAERKELEKHVKAFEKQLKTYEAAVGILSEKGLMELEDFEK